MNAGWAREEDRTSLATIMADVFLADQARNLPEPLDPAFVRSHSEDLVARAWRDMALSRHGDEAIAMAWLDGGSIGALNVLAPFRRRGAGSRLMDLHEGRLADEGARVVTLDTQAANAPAIAFYVRRGYSIIRRWEQKAFTRLPIPTVTMTMELERK